MTRKQCTVDGCGRPATKGSDYCAPHERRVRLFGDPRSQEPIIIGRPPLGITKQCSIKGCGRSAHARGFCEPHYQRWLKQGDVMESEPIIQRGPRRRVEG